MKQLSCGLTLLVGAMLFGATSGFAADRWWTTGSCAVGGAGTWSGGTAAQWSTASTGGGCVSWANGGDTMFFGGGAASATYAVQMGTAATTFTVNKVSIVSGGATRVDLSNVTFGTMAFSGADAGVEVPAGEYFTLQIKYTGTVKKTGPGRLDCPNQSLSAKLIAAGGMITMPGSGRLNGTGSDAITFDGGGLGMGWAATGTQSWTSGKGVTVNSGGAFFGGANSGHALAIDSPIIDGTGGTGTGGLNVANGAPFFSPYTAGAGLVLQNATATANSYKGPTTVASNCRLILGAANQIPDDSVVLLDTGSVFNLAGFSETVKSLGNRTGTGGSLQLGGATLTIDDPAGEAYASTITGTGAKIIKKGSGTWTLTGATGWGNFQLDAGTMQLGGVNALGNGTLTINGGKLCSSGTANRSPVVASVVLASDVTLGDAVNTGNLTWSAGWQLNGASRQITVDTVTSTINGGVSQDAAGRGLTKAGGGILVLGTTVNTYTGPTTVNAGTLRINVANSIDSASAITVGGGTLDVQTFNQSSPSVTLTAGTITGTSGILTSATDYDAQGGTVAAILGGAVGLNKTGVGTVALQRINTYTGGTTNSAGVLSVDADATIGDGNGILVLSGGDLLAKNNRTDTVFISNNILMLSSATIYGDSAVTGTRIIPFTGNLTGDAGTTLTIRNTGIAATTFRTAFHAAGINFPGPIVVGHAGDVSGAVSDLSFFNSSGDQTFSGDISGSGVLRRTALSGGGRTILTGNNTYTGGTTVSQGTLLVNNTVGSGTGPGAVTVNGGVLGGTGSIAGAVTVNSGGTLAPGASVGTLTLTLAPILSGTTAMEVNRNGGSPLSDKLVVSTGGGTLTYGGALTIANVGAALQNGDTFDLFDGASDATPPLAGAFSSITPPGLGLIWNTSQLAVDGTISVSSLAVNAGADIAMCSGFGVSIGGGPTASGGSGGYTYSWSPATGLDDATIANPTANPTSTTTYTVTITDSLGATTQDSVTVTVNDSAPTLVSQPANQTACEGGTATFTANSGSLTPVTYTWLKRGNAGWGSAWATSGSGSTFRGSSTDNNFGDAACMSLNAANDVNSGSGNALGMWGGLSGDHVATRSFAALTAGKVVSVDFDNGNVDTGSKVGFSLQTSGGADVLQFYFLGGASFYKYNDGTEQDTTVGFQRTGVRVQFVLNSATTYTLLVTPCGGATTRVTGTYSGTIEQIKLFNQNNTVGNDKNVYFNNFLVGGYADNADNYPGDYAGQDKGDQPIGAGNGSPIYITPALTAGDSGAQYQVIVSSCGGTILSDIATLTVNPPATVNAGSDQITCASSPAATLAGSIGGSAASATWSGGAGSFVPDANALNAVYTPSAGEITAGTVTLTLTTDDPAGPCGAVADSVTITINPAATANAGSDQTVCASSPATTLAGLVGGSGTGGTWSGGAGSFAPDANTLNAVYTPTAGEITAGTVTLTLTTDDPTGPCGAVADSMTITINPSAIVNAGADQAVCANSPAATLAGSIGGSAASATWSGGAGSFAPDANALNAVYTPTAGEITAGTVTLTLTTDDPTGPCGAVADSVTIAINPVATVNAGPDQTICSGSGAVLAGSIGGSATSATWTGAGTFTPNANDLNATYTPTAGEILAGTATVTLTTDDPSGPCGAVGDSVTISIATITANTVTYQRSSGSSLKIMLSALLPNASDNLAQTITFVGVGTDGYNLTTTNNVTLTTNASFIGYSGTGEANDSFSYKVINPQGCTAIGTVLINVVGPLGGVAQDITTGGGSVTVDFAGIPGYQYVVERADNVGFSLNVTNLSTNTAPANGQFSVTDDSPPSPSAFYRLKYAP